MTLPSLTQARLSSSMAGLLALGLLLQGCVSSRLTVPPVETLTSAPPAIAVSDASLSLDAELIRPPADAAGDRPGITIDVRLQNERDGGVPPGLTADALFLVYEGAVWSSRVETPRGATEVRVRIEGGPRWPPGERIDVVVRLVPRGGQAFFLRAPAVAIQSGS